MRLGCEGEDLGGDDTVNGKGGFITSVRVGEDEVAVLVDGVGTTGGQVVGDSEITGISGLIGEVNAVGITGANNVGHGGSELSGIELGGAFVVDSIDGELDSH